MLLNSKSAMFTLFASSFMSSFCFLIGQNKTKADFSLLRKSTIFILYIKFFNYISNARHTNYAP